MGYRMVRCKSCGADIARSANVCPNCGAKQHQAAYALAAIVTVAMCATLFFALRGGASEKPQDRPLATASVTSITLWHDYSENKVNADSLYKDKVIAVSGTIVDISQDVVTKAPMIALSSGAKIDLYPIQCFFAKDSEYADKIAAMRNGQEITIVGVCDGTPLVHVQITDCYLP